MGLPEWETDVWEACFEHRWASFNLYKPAWNLYWVDLQFAEFGQKVLLGIVRDPKLVNSGRPHFPEILAAVRGVYPSAKSSKWWEAYVELRSPASNWQQPEVLWRMQTDASFLQAVAEQMIMLAKATEALLDSRNEVGR